MRVPEGLLVVNTHRRRAGCLRLRAPLRGVARGQTLVLYRPDPDGDEVLGSATIAGTSR